MSLISPFSSSTPRKTAFHSKLSEIDKSLNQLRGIRRVWQFSGPLLVFSVYSYRVRELLVFWLFFSLLFVLLVLVILGGVLTRYAGKYATHWTSTTASITPVLALGSAELHLKTVTRARKFN